MLFTTPRTITAAAATAAILALTLAGCSPADDEATTPTPTATQTEDAPPPEFGGEQGEIPAQEDILNDPDLRNTVLLEGCEATDDGWTATGTAENTSDSDDVYQLVVFYTDAQARVVISSTVDVAVAAGDTVDWAAPATFTATEGTQCVLAGVGYAP